MGRTVPSFRPALEHEIESWKNFKRALRSDEKFNKLMNYARIHADAGSMSARPMLSEILFISFAVEQEKRIEMLEEKVKELLQIPTKWKVVALITFGYPAEQPKPKKRKPITELVSFNKFR